MSQWGSKETSSGAASTGERESACPDAKMSVECHISDSLFQEMPDVMDHRPAFTL
jgi:hypothetical protein